MTEEQFDEKYKEKLDAEAERFICMIRNSKNDCFPEPKKWWQL